MKKEELETMSYIDIANKLLEEKPLTTKELLEQIKQLLNLTAKELENKIGDFYTSLTTDQRFILLKDGKWDLKINHKTEKIIIEDEDEEPEEPEQEELIEEEEKEDIYKESNDEDTDDITEEYKNLVIVDEEDLNIIE